MKLAEALALRGDLQKRIEQLRERIMSSSRYQEGEAPSEDATELLVEVNEAIDRLQGLVAAINVTNSATVLSSGESMTSALARRDALRLRHNVLSSVANAASGANGYRQMRSELRQITAIDVPALRSEIDAVAQDLRETDGQIQQANWATELLEN